MSDNGQHRDGAAGDGVFGAELPAFPADAYVRFYAEAVANTDARTVAYKPPGAEHDVYVYSVKADTHADAAVVINELMASNATTVQDPQGEYEDWIELHNRTNQPIDLSGYYLTDKADNPTKFKIPAGVPIPANGYLIFWADENGSDGPTHCNFRLSADGELVLLFDTALTLVDSVTFGPQQTGKGYARVPNGAGRFRIQAPTFAESSDIVGTHATMRPHAGLRVSPNPTAGSFVVEVERLLGSTPITVFDVHGASSGSSPSRGFSTTFPYDGPMEHIG